MKLECVLESVTGAPTKTFNLLSAPRARRNGILTTEHPASSYGNPVLLIDGVPHGPADVQGRLRPPTDIEKDPMMHSWRDWSEDEKDFLEQFCGQRNSVCKY